VELFDATQIALERALQGSSLRQRVLSNNLANANTPGFKRSDVDFHESLARELQAGGSARDALERVSFAPVTDSSSSMRADGNNVDVDEEMAMLQENSLDYQSLVTIARARIMMLKTAIGSGA
jgi:flagellar basal-body rod protein FlgB